MQDVKDNKNYLKPSYFSDKGYKQTKIKTVEKDSIITGNSNE